MQPQNLRQFSVTYDRTLDIHQSGEPKERGSTPEGGVSACGTLAWCVVGSSVVPSSVMATGCCWWAIVAATDRSSGRRRVV